MPTHHDETLLERYQREHREYEGMKMSKAEELADKLELEWRNNALDYDTALDASIELRRLDAEVEELRSERTAWRVTAENAEKDAARYRHLREADPDGDGPYITRHVCNDWGKWFNTVEFQAEADAAIDAAITRTQEQT